MPLPSRVQLPHDVPGWVPGGSLYFLTVCGNPKGCDQFCRNAIAERVLDSVRYYHEQGIWTVRLFLIMPDHVHGIFAFPSAASIKRTISAWKGYIRKNCGVNWQRDFFEHRLRNPESEIEKAHYIRANPVRAGLTARAEEWPYVWPKDP